MTGHGEPIDPDIAVTAPLTLSQARSQVRTYIERHQIPAEIVPDEYKTPSVGMRTNAKRSALLMPIPTADRLCEFLPYPPVVSYPLRRRAAVFVVPDRRLNPVLLDTLDRAGIRLASPGTWLELPVEGSECPWHWRHLPRTHAQFAPLSDVAVAMAWAGIVGSPLVRRRSS